MQSVAPDYPWSEFIRVIFASKTGQKARRADEVALSLLTAAHAELGLGQVISAAQPWDYGGGDTLVLSMVHDANMTATSPTVDLICGGGNGDQLVSGQHFIYENNMVPEFPSALVVHATCIVPADITSLEEVWITNRGPSMWGVTEKTGLNISVSPGQIIAASVVISFQ